jgi:hypothetical protein
MTMWILQGVVNFDTAKVVGLPRAFEAETARLACNFSLLPVIRTTQYCTTPTMSLLSEFVASPTLDLTARLKGASSRLASTTVDVTSSASSDSALPISPVTRAAISIEYASLRHDKHCPAGMYVTPSAESMLIWDAVLFVHKGK